MEVITLFLFCTILIVCLILHISIVYALLAGLVIFCLYGKLKNYSWAELARMIVSGIKAAKSILIAFVLIGMLTALWRASGAIPLIICSTVQLLNPGTVLLVVFLLNCAFSMLTGTAFGTAATIGVICMTVAVSMQIPPILAGGAILSGVFFGDRNSPVSTSALLVSALTRTDIFANIKLMLRTAFVPFLLTCAAYALAGLFFSGTGEATDLRQLFGGEFVLHWSVLLPAIAIFALAVIKVGVKTAMSISIITAILVCFFVQHAAAPDILRIMATGYSAKDQEIAAMLNGGGVVSMLKVIMIVCISSAYAGIFQVTGILNPTKKSIIRLNKKVTSFGGMLFTSIVTAMISCNQTLTIMLTHQLYSNMEPDSQKLAIDLENTAVVVSPLIPWSIAGALPLASIGAPTTSLLAACFLYLLPAWRLISYLWVEKRLRGQ